MLKSVDTLFHFTNDFQTLIHIMQEGFKPSYAREKLGDRSILIPMVSFSNILLRDVGNAEVLSYGDFAIGFNREWGIANKLNPVVYTYEDGLMSKAIQTLIQNFVFLHAIHKFKEPFKAYSDSHTGPFSKHIAITNTSSEALAIMDYLSVKYDEDLLQMISKQAQIVHSTNLSIFSITKPYKVSNAKDENFIAYNDREWRKLYPELNIVFESDAGLDVQDEEYKKWTSTDKPHFPQEEYRLKYSIEDVKVILIKEDDDIEHIVKELKAVYTDDLVDHVIQNNSLAIGTKDRLIEQGF